MINTWTQAKLPYETRRRPIVAVPTNLIGCVVQELFHLGNHKAAYYQGLVTNVVNGLFEVLWTDGKVEHYTEQKVRSMVYDPVAAIYDFQL
eukprot:scaffold709_cov495-Pavlova_lutheri.AAC.1